MRDEAVRWFMVAFFTLFGLWLLRQRQTFARAGKYFCAFCLDGIAQSRLESAVEDRQQSEALPSAWMSGILGTLSLLLAAIAAFTRAQLTILYAINVVAFALVLAVSYLRVRRSQVRRTATLRVRNPSEILPAYAWAIVSVTVVLPLVWLPYDPVASCLVTAAGIGIVFLARLTASMPALLRGEDVVVESFVDRRLRMGRALDLLMTAAAPPFLFEAFSGPAVLPIVQEAALILGPVTMGVVFWQRLHLLRGPSKDELAMWANASS